MNQKKWRHQYDQDEADRLSRVTALHIEGESLTVQSERDNCDLNVLVRRFGIAPLVAPVDPTRFGVFDSDLDLQRAMEVVGSAKDAFAELPAEVRAKFANDPMRLLAAVQNAEHDEDQRLELEELGVFKARARPVAEAGPPPKAESSGGDPPKE